MVFYELGVEKAPSNEHVEDYQQRLPNPRRLVVPRRDISPKRTAKLFGLILTPFIVTWRILCRIERLYLGTEHLLAQQCRSEASLLATDFKCIQKPAFSGYRYFKVRVSYEKALRR